MAGLGAFLGGALQGAGAGLAEVGKQQWIERRVLALETLRSQSAQALEGTRHKNQLAEQDNAAVNDDWRASRQSARSTSATIKINDAETGNRVRIIGAQQGADVALARVRAGLERSNTEAALRLKDELDGGDIDSLAKGENGNYFTVDRRGNLKDTGVRFAPEKAEGDDIMSQIRRAQPAARPTSPSAQPADVRNAQPQRIRSGDKTYTAKDADATARKHGVPIEEVHRRMRANGYKLSSE